MKTIMSSIRGLLVAGLAVATVGCLSEEPTGIMDIASAPTTVKMDFRHRPLPEIPLPNDIATRYDASSATGRRINASLVAPTEFERRARHHIDLLDGWGVFQPISIPFTGPLDVQSILDGHRDQDFDLSNDVFYLVNVDRDSVGFGEFVHLDVGNGNYPVVLENIGRYWENDPRGDSISLFFEETDEDINGNGVLDRGEDTDADGLLDKPNYLPGMNPDKADLPGRADALMTFYEKETNTVLMRPMVPLRERTTYAMVVTKRLKDENQIAVGSPYPFANHAGQTEALEPLAEVLAKQNVSLSDVAFAFTYTTQSVYEPWKAVRDGLYGHGVQAHLGNDHPADVIGLETLRDTNHVDFENVKNPFILHHEDWEQPLTIIAQQFLNARLGSLEMTKMIDAHRFVDYHVIGSYDSPQLMPRTDADGKALPFTEQVWPADLESKPAPAASEKVYFHLMVPRKEVSARGEGKPVPVVILGHGYGSNRFDIITIGPFLARHGVAVIAIDCVSHGIGLNEEEATQATDILGIFGLAPLLDAIVNRDRAFDQNNDQNPDSGADFWSAYLFHTRDVVRQSAVDYMQLVRMLRGFDGTREFGFDVNGDGKNELAGDFDGDGVVDIGGSAAITMMGASLGGIMSSVVGALEPEISASVPIAAGGGLGDVAIRSFQGGVPEAVVLRLMGPLFVGTQAPGVTSMPIDTIVPDTNDDRRVRIGQFDGLTAGDFIVVENVTSEERGCGYVLADDDGTLRFRGAVETTLADTLRLVAYGPNASVLGSTECEVIEGATAKAAIDSFGGDVSFQGKKFGRGQTLVALAEGMGLPRSSPRIRRFMALAQLVLDNADPAVYAPLLGKTPMTYPGTGLTTGSPQLIVTTAGDMNVPASTGVTIGRAAGYIDYLTADPKHGKTHNQVLIDTYTVEAVDTLKRFTTTDGSGVIMDIENFSGGNDPWGAAIPRLETPLRIGMDAPSADGKYRSAIFPFPIPTGSHGFPFPGVLVEMAQDACTEACAEGTDCGCDAITPDTTFDVGAYLFNMFAHYLVTEATELSTDQCLSRDDCDFLQDPPAQRSKGMN
ncbi:MAG: hypothetical protein ACI9OJ_002186 [Myxococcota bacterium]|jgi:hypothetical protein